LPKIRKAGKLKATGDYKIYKPYVDEIVTKWMTPLVRSAGVKYVVEGKENIPDDETVLFMANHQGMFDFPIGITCFKKPCAYIVKKEAESYPLVNHCMRLMDCIYIDRDNAREALKSLDAAARLINDGRSVIIFPEGTRSKTGEIGEFKNGAYKIIEKTHCKVIPVLINGTRHALEETGNVVPTDVKVKILPAFDTKDMDRKQIKALPSKIREMLVEELAKR
jgi:1-acyl-sn-glycerol-3-phosphate acyltransferase